MQDIIVPLPVTALTPTDWVQRRTRLPREVSRTIAELAFDGRVRALADRGTTIEAAQRESAR